MRDLQDGGHSLQKDIVMVPVTVTFDEAIVNKQLEVNRCRQHCIYYKTIDVYNPIVAFLTGHNTFNILPLQITMFVVLIFELKIKKIYKSPLCI